MNNLNDKGGVEMDVFQTKNKRDQYVYEIRKQKVDQMIQQKRFKLVNSLQKNLEGNPRNNLNQGTDTQTGENQQELLISFPELTVEFFSALSNHHIDNIFKV